MKGKDCVMDFDVAPVPIPLRREQLAASIEEHHAAATASRLIESLLAAGGPQERVAAVADRIAAHLGLTPVVAAEVHTLGQEVASLEADHFARMQDVAWADFSETEEVEERSA